MRRYRYAGVLLCAALFAGASPLSAQLRDARRVTPTLAGAAAAATLLVRPGGDSTRATWAVLNRLPLWSAPLASALIPGLGQARQGNDRFVGYLATEGYLLLQYVRNIREREDNARTYRAIARDVARRSFPGTHPDTVWQYYEKMEKYLESGAYSLTSSAPTVPQTDLNTYNGEVWRKARLTYGISLDDQNPTGAPLYSSALDYYETFAITQPYGWSWNNAQLERDLFRQSIHRVNDFNRQAKNHLIGLIANHVFSAIDAFAVFRLTQVARGELRASATLRLP
ncbi:MAG: hypothetical protein V4550_01455 [Gemmatimonadota bacterium]